MPVTVRESRGCLIVLVITTIAIAAVVLILTHGGR